MRWVLMGLLLVACSSSDEERALSGQLGNANARIAQLERELAACQSGDADEEGVESDDEVEEQPAAAAGPPPLVPFKSQVRANSAGTPELTIWVRNDSDKTIDAARFNAWCINNFGEPVTSRIRHAEFFRGNYQAERERENLVPGRERRLASWSMFRFEGCTKANVEITELHFTDGTTWTGEVRQEGFPDSAI